MSQWIQYLIIFAAGMALGALYFGGLWHTLRRLPDTGRPVNLLLWSFLVRATLAVTGLGLAMDGRWERLAAALGGFILIREVLVRRLGRNAS